MLGSGRDNKSRHENGLRLVTAYDREASPIKSHLPRRSKRQRLSDVILPLKEPSPTPLNYPLIKSKQSRTLFGTSASATAFEGAALVVVEKNAIHSDLAVWLREAILKRKQSRWSAPADLFIATSSPTGSYFLFGPVFFHRHSDAHCEAQGRIQAGCKPVVGRMSDTRVTL